MINIFHNSHRYSNDANMFIEKSFNAAIKF